MRKQHWIVRCHYGIALAALMLAAAPLGAQTFPSKAVEFVVHSGPGGGPDQFARVVTEIITKEKLLSQPVNVNNRTGGGGSIAFNFIKSKHGDPHYILGIGTGTLLAVAARPDTDLGLENFTPLAFFGLDAQVVAVAANSKYTGIKELIEAAKREPNTQSAGVTSATGFGRQVLFLMERDLGAKFKSVIFKSGIDAALAVVGGHVLLTTENISETMPLVEGGKLRLLAVTTDKRAAVAPAVPTMKEMGYPIVTGTGRGFAMPAGVPKDAVVAMEAVLKRVHEHPLWKEFARRNAYEDIYMNGADFGRYLVRNREEMIVFLTGVGFIPAPK